MIDKPRDGQLDWQLLDSSYDEDAGLILFDKRIDHMRNNPPPEDWDGVFVMKTK